MSALTQKGLDFQVRRASHNLRAVRSPVLLTPLLLSSAPALADQPWHERASCRAVVEASFGADFAAAERQLSALEATRDLDDTACALWARTSLAEFQIAVLGKTPANLAGRRKAISRLFGFAKANGGKGVRFADLELEARMRRVRVLVEEGNRSAGLDEGKQLQKMLEGRPRSTPTIVFVEGTLNGALASTGWAARAALSVVGLGSDGETAAKALHSLGDGDSIYKWDALYMARHFAEGVGEEHFRKPSTYSRTLLDRFPENPQLAYELARDLYSEKRVAEARKAVAQTITRLDANPGSWSPRMRAKLLWIAGRTALETGDKPEAQRRGQLAAAQKAEEMKDEIEDLLDDSDG